MAFDADIGMVPEPAGPDVWRVLSRRKGLLLLGLAVGLGLAYLHHSRQPVFYRSGAQILVQRKTPPALPIDSLERGPAYEDRTSIRTQELVIKSPLVIQRAVAEHNLQALPTLAVGDPARAIIASLNVDEVEMGSNVLSLTYTASQAADAQGVLSAVIASYQDFLGETQEDVGAKTKEFIAQAKDELLDRIKQKEGEYRTFKQDAPLLWVEEKGKNYFQERLARIETDRSDVLVERSKLGALLFSIEEALRQGKSREAILLMAGEALEGRPGVQGPGPQSPFQLFLPLYVERQNLLQRFGPDHPKVIAVNKQIELTRDFLASESEAAEGAAAREQPTDFLTVYIDSLKQQLEANRQREESLNRLFDEEQRKAKELSGFEAQDIAFRSEIGRMQQLFDAVVKRLEELSLIKDAGGFTVSELSPATPGHAVQLNLVRTMVIGGVLGLMVGCLLAYVVDGASRTFYRADEISRALQIPLVGHIPFISRSQRRKAAGRSKLDPILYTFALPRASIAEAYRAVRTAIFFRTDGSSHRVIQVTSPTPGDGKTTLAGNLAITIAQSGKRVLLLDADFRKPRVHRLFQIANEAGLAAVIDGETELDDAIQSTPVDNLFVMPCGKRPNNPSELLSSPRFEELLAVLRERYDFVVLDTPPLLAVTDPSTIAPRVDGVLLTLRIQKGVRPNAERAVEMLRNLGAEVLGVVVNGVGKGHGYRYDHGGYYGSYRGYNGRAGGQSYYDDAPEEHADPAHTFNGRAH